MSLKWWINVDTGDLMEAWSVSHWFAGQHVKHPLPPDSSAESAKELAAVQQHGHFSVWFTYNARTASREAAAGIQTLIYRAPNPAFARNANDWPERAIADAFMGKSPQDRGKFPMTIALSRSDGKTSVTVLAMTVQAAKVTNVLSLHNGYIFDFMAAGKMQQQFMKE
jgi:hypothetical protein